MKTTPPTLDYTAAKPHSRLRKWIRRILLAVLVAGCLYASPIAWLYMGWKQEQSAQKVIEGVGGVTIPTSVGPAFLSRVIPGRFAWLRDRIVGVDLRLNDKVTDSDLRVLRALHYLREINLYGTGIGDAGLVYVGEVGTLQKLGLDGTRITDDGLVHLNRLKQIRTLCLSRQNSSAALAHLAGLTSLRELLLCGAQVSDEALADLQVALPGCEIAR